MIPMAVPFFALLIAHASARLVRESDMISTSEKPYTYCSDPVSKGQVIFPDSIAGRTNQNYKMYSGYIPVGQETTASSGNTNWLFYWFFEADNSSMGDVSPEDVPLILWTNGGPGCSSMEGATTENGPLVLFKIKESYDLATGQLSDNAYAWNKQGHVLYIDQPKYVGNSFGSGLGCKSSVEAANDIVTFLQGWYDEFPEFAANKVVISGESYGGHYIPAWANAIMDHNDVLSRQATADAPTADAPTSDAPTSRPIPMVGIAIGNGCVNNTVQSSERYIEFLQKNHLLPDGAAPASQGEANALMDAYIGYEPNYYDFRLRSVTCEGCYGYNYSTWSSWFLLQEVMDALHVCGDAGVDAFQGAAGGCIPMVGFDAGDDFGYSAALGRALDANVSVLMYYGKNDLACNYVGAYAMATSLPWVGASDFNGSPLLPFAAAGLEGGGEVQMHRPSGAGALIWVQVDAAGHMVPLDEPAAAAAALAKLMEQI